MAGHLHRGEAEGKPENVDFIRQMLRKYPEAAVKSKEVIRWLATSPGVQVLASACFRCSS